MSGYDYRPLFPDLFHASLLAFSLALLLAFSAQQNHVYKRLALTAAPRLMHRISSDL